ncbi:hypothetical protein CPC08DRAFT_651431 [Agrocybe pediades]|nr:hypothetical protein CPC08DRAFT_651431 [Agrocybe pediades]
MPGNGRNQHKPLPPIEMIAPHIYRYWKMRLTEKDILQRLKSEHIDTSQYGIGLTSFRAIRKSLGLLGTRQQQHNLESIAEDMQELRVSYPKAGARDMVDHLFFEKGKKVSRYLVIAYFLIFEPELVRERKARKLKRRQFWAAGVNDLFAVDQHDKWKKYGLALHAGIDPFPGVIHWVKIWWTNNNPKLIASYYLDAAKKQGAIPLVTQSDPGSENYGIANAHTALRHALDPSLRGTIQHRWMHHKKNVMPEITWSQLRRRWSPGYENLIQSGVLKGIYDMNRPIDVLVFRWLFIPFLQSRLDTYADQINYSKKRSDKNKVLPHGIPMDIYYSPKNFGCLDFKIPITEDEINKVRDKFAPPTDPVFQLVPPQFGEYAAVIYEGMGSPALTRANIWDVYSEMVEHFERLDDYTDLVQLVQAYLSELEKKEKEELEEAHPPEGQELEGGYRSEHDCYMGGVNNGRGLGKF